MDNQKNRERKAEYGEHPDPAAAAQNHTAKTSGKHKQTSMEDVLLHLEQNQDHPDQDTLAQDTVVSSWDDTEPTENDATAEASVSAEPQKAAGTSEAVPESTAREESPADQMPESEICLTPAEDEAEGTDVLWDFPHPETAEEKFRHERTDLDLDEDEDEDKASDGLPLPKHHTAETVQDDDPNGKKHKKHLLLWIPLGCILLAAAGYLTFVFAPIPFVRYWRNIYIETAMTTGDHQWLATKFIPGGIIQSVMDQAQTKPDIPNLDDALIKRPETTEEAVTTVPETTSPVTEETETETAPETEAVPDPADILGLASLKVGEKDYAGYEVLMVDQEEGLFVSEITSAAYNGRVMLVDDPARVFVGTTPEKKTRGYRIPEMMDYYGDVVAGINASGFSDPNDCGDGKDIIGYCMSEGQTWGTYDYNMASVVLTEENKLVAGYIPDWSAYTIRDGMQFGPALVYNGEVLVEGSSGWGLHPRTAIGQREDGAIILLVIDGRVPSSLMGCTVGDMAKVMAEYGAVNAGCCDGGSSCVLAYKGEILNKNSSANPKYGRRIPNAFLVRSKKAAEDDA